MPAVELTTKTGETKFFDFSTGDGSLGNPYKSGEAVALSNLLNATTLAVPTTGLLTDFVIGAGTSISNFVKLLGRTTVLYIPPGMEGDTLFFRYRLIDGEAQDRGRLRDADGNLFSVAYTSEQAPVAIPFLTEAIGSEIALECATGTTATNQTASRTLQIKTLR